MNLNLDTLAWHNDSRFNSIKLFFFAILIIIFAHGYNILCKVIELSDRTIWLLYQFSINKSIITHQNRELGEHRVLELWKFINYIY